MPASTPNLTELFERMRTGDGDAANVAVVAVYSELRRLAGRYMRHEHAGHTLQATALVNEAYLRLMHGPQSVKNRRHFFALAAQAMRRVLVDHARRKGSAKRGGRAQPVTLDMDPGVPGQSIDVLALDEALSKLATVAPRAVRVVELRFFGGHTDAEVCDITGENLATVRREWQFARSWLKTQLGGGPVAAR